MFEILDEKGFYGFMRSLCPGMDLNSEICYELQKKGKSSVPDAVIHGGDFVILEETKLDTYFSPKQLENHLKLFYDEYFNKRYKVLLTLSVKGISEDVKRELDKKISEVNNRFLKPEDGYILHKDLTFKSLIESIEEYKSNKKGFDFIFEDFKSLFREEFLLNEREFILNAQAAGGSMEKNKELSLFYFPDTKANISYKYLGLYKEKNIKI